MSGVTVCLLNWKRPDNLRQLIAALAAQSVDPTIVLWDNAGNFPMDSRIAWHVRSTVNVACWPRWWMATVATTEFVCSFDDDLLPADNDVLRDTCEALREEPANIIVGGWGKRLIPGKDYRRSPDIDPRGKDQRCHIVKGRFMLMRTAALAAAFRANAPLHPLGPALSDDIAISGLLGKGKLCHLIPTRLRGRFQEMSDDHAIWRQPNHFQCREQYRRRFFPETVARFD